MLTATSRGAPGGQPAANLDQIRNGSAAAPNDPAHWVNGNAGPQNAHFLEGHSSAYRAVLTDLPTDGTAITLILEYDIKHSDRHAIDYLTHFQRLDPHGGFGHLAELVDPRIDVAAVAGSSLLGDDTIAIPAPSSAGSPAANQPTNSFNALPPGERVMTIYNGAFTGAIAYVNQGNLMIAK